MKTISRIAYSNDKRNRTRSILIMMAICLATMLLVIISTVGNGVIHLQKSQAAGSYGSNYGLFVSADGSQLKEVNRRAEIDATGTMCTEGIIKGNENGGFVCTTPSVPILIAALVEVSVQLEMMTFLVGPYSLLPAVVLRQMQSSAHWTWQPMIRTLVE